MPTPPSSARRSPRSALSPVPSGAISRRAPSPASLKKVMFDAALDASKILQRHFGKIDHVMTKKGNDVDLVTVADKQAEAAIIQRIRAAFPGHGILGEESGRLDAADSSDFLWVVDPLDGTTNFAHGVPIFSVSIGLLYKNQLFLGLVADVMRGEWFFARRDGGAFLYKRTASGFSTPKRLRVSKAKKISDSLIITGFPHDRKQKVDMLLRGLKAMLMTSRGVLRLGSAAIDLAWVASGRGEAFFEPSLQPWDIAAGALLVREAGGRATDFEGRALESPGHEVMASNGCIHEELLRAVREAWGREN